MRSRKPVANKVSPESKADPKVKWDKHDRKVEGEAAPFRADRPAYKRGGGVKGKHSTTVNIVMPPASGTPGVPVMPPAMPPAGLARPMPMPPAAASGPPPGVVPGAGAGLSSALPIGAKPMMNRGGRITAGAGSGKGRMQKSDGMK